MTVLRICNWYENYYFIKLGKITGPKPEADFSAKESDQKSAQNQQSALDLYSRLEKSRQAKYTCYKINTARVSIPLS